MREGYEIYEAYIMGHDEDIENGTPFDVEIKNCETFERVVVKAIISKNKLEDGKLLWVRSYAKDDYLPEPWSIKIVEEYDDDKFIERPDLKDLGTETTKLY